jgi:hypothetical protein
MQSVYYCYANTKESENISMAFYEWQDSYSVGSAAMDEQHKKMIGILNK